MRGQFLKKGLPACDAPQATTKVEDETESLRNAVTNAWNVNPSNGNRNNTNTNNRYRAIPASEFVKNCDRWLDAEAGAYRQKHHNFEAARIHFHLVELYALAAEVSDGRYYPRPMSTFILTYPVFREAFAPDHHDCIVHHYIAPLFTAVAEGVHYANGDISHGNRIGHSSQGMAERIRDDIRFISRDGRRPCFHAHRDVEGFFMHINRRKAYEMVERLSEEYYPFPDREEMLALMKVTLLSDPLEGCVRKSPISAWKCVKPNKSLFNGEPGFGLPIGKYPSQVVAGIYLSAVDAELVKIHGIRQQHFVDDYDIIAESVEKIREATDVMEKALSALDLKLHPTKISVQPAHRGMLSCGRVVKGDRIYISNRTVKACRRSVLSYPATEAGAIIAARSINSYFGLMCHCNSYKIQRRIAEEARRIFGQWLYFKTKPGHIICVVKKQYTPVAKAIAEMVELSQNLKQYETWKNHRRSHRSGGGREWERGHKVPA